MHRLALIVDQHDVVHVRTVQVYLVVVLLRIVSGNESPVLQGIALHHTSLHGLLYLAIEFVHRTDALLSAILVAPDRQRRTPEARARQVPVVEVLQPVAKPACTRRLGLPANCLVQGHQSFLALCILDEPAVEGIIEDGLVRAPAVGIVVGHLLDAEGLSLHFHLHTDDDVQVLALL